MDEAIPILPISPIDLGNFLADVAEQTGSISKINLLIAAVADRHLAGHLKSPTTDPSLRKMVTGIRRQLFRPARSRAPLDLEILEEAFKLIEGGGRLQDWRTLCRLNLEFYGMLRWAEVSALQMEDIRFDTTGMVLHIRRSKTDQLGKGTYVRINITDLEHCPVEITRLYMQKLNYGTENGFLQPQVRTYKNGSQAGVWYKKLSYSTALEDTKAFMAILGRNPADFGEHSGRRSGATAASEAGVTWIDLKRHGRWASDSAPQRYIEETKTRSNSVARALAQSACRTQAEKEAEKAAARKRKEKQLEEEEKKRYRDKGNRLADWQERQRIHELPLQEGIAPLSRRPTEWTARGEATQAGKRRRQTETPTPANEEITRADKRSRVEVGQYKPNAARALLPTFTSAAVFAREMATGQRPAVVRSSSTGLTGGPPTTETPRRRGDTTAGPSSAIAATPTAAFKPPARLRVDRHEQASRSDCYKLSPEMLKNIFEEANFNA